jgi:hypothetical protein
LQGLKTLPLSHGTNPESDRYTRLAKTKLFVSISFSLAMATVAVEGWDRLAWTSAGETMEERDRSAWNSEVEVVEGWRWVAFTAAAAVEGR